MNNSDAYLNLGIIYEEVKNDKDKAFECYQRAAELGNIKAYINLGHMYQSGEGCGGVNIQKAKQCFEKAADQGNPQAQLSLGLIYQGNGLLYEEDSESL